MTKAMPKNEAHHSRFQTCMVDGLSKLSPSITIDIFRIKTMTDLLRQPSQKPPQGVLQNALFNLPDHTLISLKRNLNELIQMMDDIDPNAQMRPLEFLGKTSEIK